MFMRVAVWVPITAAVALAGLFLGELAATAVRFWSSVSAGG